MEAFAIFLLAAAPLSGPVPSAPPRGIAVQAGVAVQIIRAERVTAEVRPGETQRQPRRDAAGRVFIDFT